MLAAQMGTLLGETLPLALGAAVSPVLFLAQLTTLTGSRPIARGSALALGAALPLALLGVVAVAAGTSSHSLRTDPTIKAALDLSLGALLLLLAGWTALRRPRPRADREAKTLTLRRSFLLGAGAMATNFSTIVLYLAALKLIAPSDVGDFGKALVALLVFALSLTVVIVPLALTAAAPGPAGRVLSATGTWMSARRRSIGIVLLLAFGGWLTAKGARAL